MKVFFIPRTGNPYPTEFREQLVALARAGRSAESLAREYEPCAGTIHFQIAFCDLALKKHVLNTSRTAASQMNSSVERENSHNQSSAALPEGNAGQDI